MEQSILKLCDLLEKLVRETVPGGEYARSNSQYAKEKQETFIEVLNEIRKSIDA